ncbi:hypothetical protein DNK34_16250 [Pseudomonas dryadis]|uniref:Secreted protein n=1 Tax=Phytopseudomonas dryadis TaxID=2487520 RepID=A0ABY1Z3P9_9GAMM|nr:hypothetical protein DNK34_16250 [Pseudomonas dryadis]TBV16544.1 hypothetical protein DNK41_14655 [Pseudomonas sp. FRB 230]
MVVLLIRSVAVSARPITGGQTCIGEFVLFATQAEDHSTGPVAKPRSKCMDTGQSRYAREEPKTALEGWRLNEKQPEHTGKQRFLVQPSSLQRCSASVFHTMTP